MTGNAIPTDHVIATGDANAAGPVVPNGSSQHDLQEAPWTKEIPEDQWIIYRCVWEELQQRGIPFALGGAMALAAYVGHWRNTKDLDFYILPQARDEMIGVLRHCGLSDYYDVLPYERHWIYRAHHEGIIVDAIWAMANRRAEVDMPWLCRGPQVRICGELLPIAAPEELLWGKLYVMQRERCDWPDLFNLLFSTGPGMDWNHLLMRVGEDKPLLRGLLSVFAWLAPECARQFPPHLWKVLELPEPEASTPDATQRHIDLLDTRTWLFAAEKSSN